MVVCHACGVPCVACASVQPPNIIVPGAGYLLDMASAYKLLGDSSGGASATIPEPAPAAAPPAPRPLRATGTTVTIVDDDLED